MKFVPPQNVARRESAFVPAVQLNRSLQMRPGRVVFIFLLLFAVCFPVFGDSDFAWTPETPEAGQVVSFIDRSSVGPIPKAEWRWDFGDGGKSGEANPKHVYAIPGTYTVSLSVRWANPAYPNFETSSKQIRVVAPAAQLTAMFDVSSDPRVGQTVTFTDRSSGEPTAWLWMFGDGGSATTQHTSHVYTTPGNHVVSLRVTKDGKTDLRIQTVRVTTGGPALNARFAWAPTTPAIGQTVTFSDLSDGQPLAWEWDFGDGSKGAGRSPVHAFARADTYTVRLTTSDGVETSSSTQVIKVAERAGNEPIADFAFTPAVGVVGQPVAFVDRSTANPKRWEWSFGDGTTSAERNPTHTYALAAGSFVVSLTVTNDEGSSTRSYPISIKENGKPPVASFFVSPESPIAGQQVQLVDTSRENPTSWTWTIANVAGAGRGRVFNTVFPAAGAVDVTLTVENAFGRASTTRTITVEAPRQALAPNFTFPPGALYAGSVVFFEDATTPAATKRRWSFGDGSAPSDAASPSHVFGAAGVYNVTLQVTHHNESASVTKKVTIERLPLPKASFTVLPAAPLVGGVVAFESTSTGSPTEYQWSGEIVTEAGKALLGLGFQRSMSWSWDVAGTYAVTLKVINAAGSDSVTRLITVYSADPPKPVVKSVRSTTGRCFFNEHGLMNELVASVDWKGTPKALHYTINGDIGTLTHVTPMSGGGTIMLDTGRMKGGSSGGLLFQNVIAIFATNDKNLVSDSLTHSLFVFQQPHWLQGLSTKTQRERDRYSVTASVNMPFEPIEFLVTPPKWVPVVGGEEVGLKKTQWTYDYVMRSDCTATSSAKGETGFKKGKYIITGNLTGGGELVITPTQGLLQKKSFLGLEIAGAIEQEQELLGAIPFAKDLCVQLGAQAICQVVKGKVEVKAAGGLTFWFVNTAAGTEWGDTTGSLTPEVKFSAALKLTDNIYLEAFAGGKYGFTIGPSRVEPVQPRLRKFEVVLEAGFKGRAYLFARELKFSYVCTSENGNLISCTSNNSGLAAGTNGVFGAGEWQPLLPEYPVGVEETTVNRSRIRGETIVADRMFSLAAPSAARTGDTTVVAYVHENAAASNLLHRTDIRWMTMRDGQWSEPRALTSDALAEFAPALTTRADGRVVALWQRARSNGVTYDDIQSFQDLSKLNAEMEMVIADYDREHDRWSEPVALTSNEVLDFNGRLAALGDGTVIAVWLRDPSNQLVGSAPAQIVSRRYAAGAWSDETVIASGLNAVRNFSLASSGTHATVTFTREKGADATTTTDSEIAVVVFADGAWTAMRDLTSDDTPDLAPSVVYRADGQARVAWMRGDALVWQAVNGTGTPSTMRAVDGAAAMFTRWFVRSPNGRLAMLTAGRKDGSPDVVVSTYDDASGKWSDDVAFTRTASVESSLSPFFIDDERLAIVALDTAVLNTTATALVEGKPTAFEGVPQSGQSSLLYLEKSLRVDLQAVAGGLGPMTEVAAGAPVTLRAAIVNAGDLSIRDVPYRVHRGRGTDGAVLGAGVVSGDWLAGQSRTIDIDMTAEEGAVTFVIDPDRTTPDANQSNNVSYFSFANRPPVACVQVSQMVGVAPMQVNFDAACSSDSDGSIISYRWTFAGDAAAAGRTATHTFTTTAAHPVTLTVTDDSGRSSSRTLEIYAGAIADRRQPQARASLHVPVVGRTVGVGNTFFVSDAVLLNSDARADLEVEAVYMPAGRTGFHYFSATVPPGQILDMPDILAQRLSAPAGTGWLRFDLSHAHALVTTRSYNAQPGGTAGSAVPGLESAAAVARDTRQIFLQDWRSGYRTNIGFAEIAGQENDVTISMFDEQGKLVGASTHRVGPFRQMQVNADPMLQRPGRIEVTSDSGTVIAYVTTTDNGTGDFVFQQGTSSSRLQAGARWMVPTAARLAGANNTVWRTDVRAWNGGTAAAEVTVSFTSGSTTVEKTKIFQAGQTVAFDDIITSLFPEITGSAGGSLFLSSSAPLVVSSRTYNVTAQGTYGLVIPGRLDAELTKEGELVHLIGLRSDADFRCNAGFTGGDAGARLLVSAFSASGELLGEATFDVASRQNLPVNGIFGRLDVHQPLQSARLEVRMLSGSAYVFATVIDNKNGDGTFVEGQR
jgi:PKD repeat protein